MNKDVFEGNWKQLKGDVKKRWGLLTDDQMDQIDGNREKFLGMIQENYGVVRDEAEKQLNEWENHSALNQKEGYDMKIFTALLFAALVGMSTMAYAEDLVILDDGNDSIISGTVTDIGFQDITLRVDGEDIRVEVEDLDLDNATEDYLSVGTYVQAVGSFDNGDFEAHKIIKTDAPESAVDVRADID